jgi:two-component system, chemotaxis family, sensor kinase CheA
VNNEISLDELLAVEIEKRLGPRESSVDPEALRILLHSLRGSVAMTGHTDLALVVGQLGARCRQREDGVSDLAIEMLRGVAERLRNGLAPFETAWPVPPPALLPSAVDASQRAEYRAAMLDRLTELDTVITLQEPRREGLEHAFRIVHSMKGTASAVGDDTTAWYCHGLESRLRTALEGHQESFEPLTELARHGGTIARLIDDPDEAFAMLRALRKSVPLRKTTPAPMPKITAHPSSRPAPASWMEELEGDTDVSIRVPGATFERIFDHLEHLDVSVEELIGASESASRLARELRDVNHELLEVQRLAVPANNPSADASLVYRLEQLAQNVQTEESEAAHIGAHCLKNAELLRNQWSETRNALSHLRRTKLTWLFERVVRAAQRFAEGEGKLVRVDTVGGDVSIDRGLAERLLDAVMQVVRNAISHGIGVPSVRAAAGKSPLGLLMLSAERHGDWLRLVVQDDGGGVDVMHVRQIAVERGVVTEETARHLGEHELFNLLFLPGFSTRRGADVLAGRGMGLDLAQDIMRRLGGAMRLTSRVGGGVKATLEFPVERGIVDVVWLESAHVQFALPVTFTGGIKRTVPGSRTPSLGACVGIHSQTPSVMELDIAVPGVQSVPVGIDALGDVEEVVVRPLPPLFADSGPYAGAVLRGDGTLRLVLDAAVVAAKLWSRIS